MQKAINPYLGKRRIKMRQCISSGPETFRQEIIFCFKLMQALFLCDLDVTGFYPNMVFAVLI